MELLKLVLGEPARSVGWRDPGFFHTSFLKDLWPNTVFVSLSLSPSYRPQQTLRLATNLYVFAFPYNPGTPIGWVTNCQTVHTFGAKHILSSHHHIPDKIHCSAS